MSGYGSHVVGNLKSGMCGRDMHGECGDLYAGVHYLFWGRFERIGSSDICSGVVQSLVERFTLWVVLIVLFTLGIMVVFHECRW